MFSKRSHYALISILIATIYSNSVSAAEITKTKGIRTSLATISIKGDIVYGDELKFRNIALTTDYAQVVLDSPGGKLKPGLDIGRIIKIKGYSTVVQNSSCTSSCAMLWIAGSTRSILDGGRVGFHGAYVVESGGKPLPDNVGNAWVGAYLYELGFNNDVIEYATVSNPEAFKWVTPASAASLNLPVSFSAEKSSIEALKLYNQGVAKTQGVNPDMTGAAELYRGSADLGFAGGLNNLGDMYEEGKGVPRDKLAAVYFYTRAAERGEPTAYLSLATILADESKDVEVLTEALKFAILAEDNLKPGRNRDNASNAYKRIVQSVPRSAFDRALKLAKEWDPLFQEKKLIGDKPSPR